MLVISFFSYSISSTSQSFFFFLKTVFFNFQTSSMILNHQLLCHSILHSRRCSSSISNLLRSFILQCHFSSNWLTSLPSILSTFLKDSQSPSPSFHLSKSLLVSLLILNRQMSSNLPKEIPHIINFLTSFSKITNPPTISSIKHCQYSFIKLPTPFYTIHPGSLKTIAFCHFCRSNSSSLTKIHLPPQSNQAMQCHPFDRQCQCLFLNIHHFVMPKVTQT